MIARWHRCSVLLPWAMGVWALLAGAGCQFGKKEPPRPFEGPAAMLKVEHFSGSPMSGPTTRPVSAPVPDRAWKVKVALVALERATPTAGEPIGMRARWIAATRGAAPVMPSSRLARFTRWIDLAGQADLATLLGAQAGRSASMLEFNTALIPGVTVGIEVADPVTRSDPVAGTIPRSRFEYRLHRTEASAGGKLQVGLILEDFVAPARPIEPPDEHAAAATQPASPNEPAAPNQPIFTRETVIVDRDLPAGGRDRFAVLVPMQLSEATGQCIAVEIEIAPGDNTPNHGLAVNAMLAGVARSARIASTRPSIAPVGIDSNSTFNSALIALSVPARRRPALVFLAANTRAALCEDVALVADDLTLEEFCTQVSQKTLGASVAWTDETLGWLLESTTFQMLAKRLADGKLAPELSAVLATYAGQAGRTPASMEELAKGLGSRQAFENRLLAENLLFLEDAQPSARVRAFDWLKSRNRAPANYDPLGPPRQRRAALEKAYAAPTTPPARGQP